MNESMSSDYVSPKLRMVPTSKTTGFLELRYAPRGLVMNESKPGECGTNEAIPEFPMKRKIGDVNYREVDENGQVLVWPTYRIVDTFEKLVARIEKIEQWIERQEQHQVEQNERH